MGVNAAELLAVLPEYRAREVLIVKRQDVGDIMAEVVEAHKFFAGHYDVIADFFWTGSVYETCRLLWNFCKKNIGYVIEPEKSQTTKSPSAILTEAYGDCKHYAGFIAGVLDAINRNFNEGIKWKYCFANYDEFNDLPQHVFVKVRDNGQEIWIDPVLNRFDERLQPVSCQYKTVNMLSRVSGINDGLYNVAYPNTIGWAWETSTGWTTSGGMPTVKWGDPFYGQDFLGVSRYGNIPRDDKAFIALRDNLQSYIDQFSPEPYPLSTDLLAKVIGENIQNWNFLYPKGTSHTPRNWRPYLQDYLLLTVTPDGRLTFDRDEEPPHNYPEIHKLVDWVNFMVQHYSDETYIPTIEHVKRLGKGWKTPDKGSLWHVIHSGDVWGAKFSDFAGKILDKIPGLSDWLGKYGLSAESLESFLGGGGATIPDVVIPDGGSTPHTITKPNWLLLGAIGAGAFLLLRKKKRSVSGVGSNKGLLLGAVGVGALIYFMKKKKEESELENLPALPVSSSILSDGLTKEAIRNQVTAPYDTTAYGADVVNEYERPTKVSDPYDLVKQTEMMYATQY